MNKITKSFFIVGLIITANIFPSTAQSQEKLQDIAFDNITHPRVKKYISNQIDNSIIFFNQIKPTAPVRKVSNFEDAFVSL